jgi:hypothetical protein
MAKTKENNILYRSFQFKREWLNEEKRQSEISFSSEIAADRWGMVEILDHSAGAIDLRRIREMGSHLFNHNPDRIIGPVISVKIDGGRGVATVGYDQNEEGDLALERTKSGSLRGVSVGYRVYKWKKLEAGEEYQLSTGKVKGREDKDIYIATKWEPIEITSTPIPLDSSVGHGRELFMRSLQEAGIEIQKKEDEPLTEEEIKKLINDSIRAVVSGVIKDAMPDLITQVRQTITDEQKPQMRMEVETANDLTNRASAVSPDTESKAIRMIFGGKTEQEVARFIIDQAIGKPDATDTGGEGGDLSQRNKVKGMSQQGAVTSFRQVQKDDEFFRAFGTSLTPNFH